MEDEKLAGEIRRHLSEILASPFFFRSKRSRDFLAWIVEQSLTGNQKSISERNIALSIYERAADFDPKVDGIVRTEAKRLRTKLLEYYETCPPDGPRIKVPVGHYAPAFSGFAPKATERQQPSYQHIIRLASASGVVTLLAVLLGLGWQYNLESMRRNDLRQAVGLTNEAVQLIRIGDNIAAAERAHAAIALAPLNSVSHRVLSRAYRNMARIADSLAEARLAESLAPPGSQEAAWCKALRLDLEANKNALGVYRQLLKLNPQSFDALLYTAQAEIRYGDFYPGIATIRRARQFPEGRNNPELGRLEALAVANMYISQSALEPNLLAAALADIKRAEADAAAVRSKRELGRLVMLEAGILTYKGTAMYATTQSVLHSGLEICTEVQDPACELYGRRLTANMMLYQGRYADALRTYLHALPLALEGQNRMEVAQLSEGIELSMSHLLDQRVPQRLSLLQPPEWPATRSPAR